MFLPSKAQMWRLNFKLLFMKSVYEVGPVILTFLLSWAVESRDEELILCDLESTLPRTKTDALNTLILAPKFGIKRIDRVQFANVLWC